MFSLFALTTSRLEGGLILPGITVIHSCTWRILCPSMWPQADMGWCWAPPSHCLAGQSEIWIEQCLIPPGCRGSRGHSGHVLADGLSPPPVPLGPGGAAAFAAHPGWGQPDPACAPGPQPSFPPWAWSPGLVFSALSVDEIRNYLSLRPPLNKV